MVRRLRELSVMACLLAAAAFSPAGARTVGPGDAAETGNALGVFEKLLGEGLTPDQRRQLAEAVVAFRASRFPEAETATRGVTEASPDHPAAWYLLGLVLANENRFDEALAALDRAGALYTANATPIVVKGDLLASLGRGDEAAAAYQAALARDPSNWTAHEGLARLAERAGQEGAAIDHYAQAVKLTGPDHPFPRLRLARLLLGRDDPAGALRALDGLAAGEAAPDEALELAGRAELAGGDAAAARGHLGRLAARGTSPRGALLLAALERETGNLAAAEKVLRGALATHPADPELHFELGNILGAQRDYPGALDSYLAGLRDAPSDLRLIKGASMADLRLGHPDRALERATALASHPDRGAGDLVWLASLQEMQDRKAEAEESYRAALALQPKNVVALNNLAMLLKDRDPARAVALAEAAGALAGENAAIRDTLGQVYLAAGRASEAVGIYAALVAAKPGDPRLACLHGRALILAGSRDRGRAELERALALAPDFDGAAEARALLGRP